MEVSNVKKTSKDIIVDSRIHKVLAMRTDSVAVLESVSAISDFYKDNTVEARRALRHDLELQNLQLAKSFLCEFDVIKERIEKVGTPRSLAVFFSIHGLIVSLIACVPLSRHALTILSPH